MMIDKLQNVGTFNTADAEQTDEDRAVFVEQQKKIAHFGAYVKRNGIAPLRVMDKGTQDFEQPAEEITDYAAESGEKQPEPMPEVISEDYEANAINDL